jgi:2'-5' RNA ligase
MRRRVFIAINLPEKIKSKLTEYQLKWPELPCRWTKKENLHITLEFLGYLTDADLIEVCQRIKEMAEKKKCFSVKLNKICYAPPGRKLPRMIWATGERIKELNLVPHITLGRIKTWQFRQTEPEERPEINEDINLNFEVNSIEVMESQLKRGGAEYIILESFQLRE